MTDRLRIELSVVSREGQEVVIKDGYLPVQQDDGDVHPALGAFV